MRMQKPEEISRRGSAANRSDGTADARPASGESAGMGDEEKVRALQELARKLDKRLLSWVQARRQPQGGESHDR